MAGPASRTCTLGGAANRSKNAVYNSSTALSHPISSTINIVNDLVLKVFHKLRYCPCHRTVMFVVGGVDLPPFIEHFKKAGFITDAYNPSIIQQFYDRAFLVFPEARA